MTRSTLHRPQYRPPSEADLAMLRGMLDQQRAFRIEQLSQLSHPGTGDPLSITDPEILRELVTGARAALREVQAALWRMDEGTYGRCTQCAGHIEIQRLEILPATATCLPCGRAQATDGTDRLPSGG